MTPTGGAGKLLDGKRALVTGGAKRIGREIAMALADAGADVAITYRDSGLEAEETATQMSAFDVRTLAVRCDVTDEVSVTTAVDRVAKAWNGLDILVNNAGLFETASLDELTVAQWDGMFAANTRGPWLVARAGHRYLAATRGRIINIGSLGGLQPWATHGHYCTSKAALHMLSQVMAKAWAPAISVNCVAPGMIVMGATAAREYQAFADRTPMARNGRAEDVAAAVMFFASGPHFITGQLLAVDGGLAL